MRGHLDMTDHVGRSPSKMGVILGSAISFRGYSGARDSANP
jgi:hypothetical protein